MSSNLEDIQNSVDTIIEAATPVTPVNLLYWQTAQDEYTVQRLDAFDTDGLGKDLIYHYAFAPAVDTVMYTQERIPFDGYDLEFRMRYTMGDSSSGDVHWTLYLDTVSTGSSKSPVTSWADWAADYDNAYTSVDTPSSTSRTYTELVFTIPSSAYSAGDTLKFALKRTGSDAADTHAAYALIEDAIVLVPVLP
jgi:hypothetical protein